MEDSVTSNDDEMLTKLVGYYEASEQTTQESRLLCERDRDYVDHKQLTATEIATLKARKQPPIVVNRIKPKVDFLLGMERQTRTDPKAFPRTPKHEQSAEAATDSIRYVLDNNEFDYLRSEVFESMLVEGTGGVEIMVEPKKGGAEIVLRQYPWDRLFWDVHSRRRDFSDAKYKGAVVWMDLEDARELGSEDVVEAALTQATDSDTYDDAPRVHWIDKQRKRIKVVSIWYVHKRKWHWAMLTSAGFLKPPVVSPFMDEDGEPECGLEIQSAFVDREGNRYGVVRGLIDIQDEINKRRSKALHLLTMRQTIGEQGAVTDIAQAKRELAKPDGHVEVTPGLKFEIASTNDLAQGQLALLQEAKGEIDAIGANAALQGKEERVMSGRAFQSRQQSCSMELGPVFDSLRAWQKRVYRQCWNRIRQYWKEERWIRVTDDERNLKWVGLNRTITIGEQLKRQLGPVPQGMENDPRLQIPVAKENELAELDVDIIVEDAPDVVTLQFEQFEQLTQMYQANPQAIPFELLIEASQLRNKDQILERMKGGGDGDDPIKMQMQQQLEQMAAALQDAQGKIEEATAAGEIKRMEVEAGLVESQRRLEEATIKHETTRIKSEADVHMAELKAGAETRSFENEEAYRSEGMEATKEAIAAMLAQNAEISRGTLEAMTQIALATQQPKEKRMSIQVNGRDYNVQAVEE